MTGFPIVRALLVAGVALLGAWQVVRAALVSHHIGERPALAERAWPNHPRVNIALAMADIGASAAAGRGASESSLRRVERAAQGAPLIADPFTIMGAVLQSRGQDRAAERLFVESKRRDPRSAAPRYFLAQRYLTTGRADAGLIEVAALARLVPRGVQAIMPALVQIARTVGPSRELIAMLRENPALAQGVLADLSKDAANADLVIQIAARMPPAATGKRPPIWQGRLLGELIERGEFRRAHALWNMMSDAPRSPAPGLFNKAFADLAAPPPFNWKLGAGGFGVVEAVPGGKLQLIYYGRENAELASQLLLLEPGRYRLSLRASGDGAARSAMAWSLTCAAAKTAMATLPLSGATIGGRMLATEFTVPAQDCDAQWLRLTGSAAEFADSEQVTISDLDIAAVGR